MIETERLLLRKPRREDGAVVGRTGLVVWDTRPVSVISPGNVRSRRVVERLEATPGGRVLLADMGPADVWEHPR